MDELRFALLGLGIGAGYVLLGQGIVLVYRGSGILNFAQGAVAMITAHVFFGLRNSGIDAPASLVLSLLVAATIGLAMQADILRRLGTASALVRLLATLGLLTLLQGLGEVLFGPYSSPVIGFLPSSYFNFGGELTIRKDRLVLLAIGLVITFVLSLVYRRTRYGFPTSAIAENERSAVVLGWSPNVIGAGNWVIGSVLGGLAGILLAPIAGLSVTGLVLLVIPGLSAALVGQFSSFWLTLAGGLGISVLQSRLTRYVQTPGWADAVPFLVIIGLVVLRGRALPLRGEFLDRPVRAGSGRIRPWILVPGVIAMGVVIDRLSGNWALAVTSTALMGTIALSVLLVTGYAGQLSLTQLTLAGVGALAAANASYHWNAPFVVSVSFGAVVAAGAGLLVGIPALRCRGMNLAVVTLGLSLVIEEVILGNGTLGGGISGLQVHPPSLFGIDLNPIEHPVRYTALVVATFIVCALLVTNLRRGRSGLRLLALRNNERAAVASGVNVFGAKLYPFALGAALSGLAGAVGAFQFPLADLTGYNTVGSINLIVQSVIGGIGYVGGAVVGGVGAAGGVTTQVLNYFQWGEYVTIGAGVLVLLTIIQHPDGVSDTVVHRIVPRLLRYGNQPQARAFFASGQEEEFTPLNGKPLSVRELCVRFGGVMAVHQVSFDVNPGEVVGLIGPNGAGKTTVIDAISGLVGSSGDVRLGDDLLNGMSPRKRALAGLGRTFQSVELFDDLSVVDNIRTASCAGGWIWYARDLVRPRFDEVSDVVRAAIGEFGLSEDLDRLPEELSAGRRRMVGIVRMWRQSRVRYYWTNLELASTMRKSASSEGSFDVWPKVARVCPSHRPRCLTGHVSEPSNRCDGTRRNH